MSKESDIRATTMSGTFFAEISDLLTRARNTAYKAVNTVMVQTYWQIGKRIVEQEQQDKAVRRMGIFLLPTSPTICQNILGKDFLKPI